MNLYLQYIQPTSKPPKTYWPIKKYAIFTNGKRKYRIGPGI